MSTVASTENDRGIETGSGSVQENDPPFLGLTFFILPVKNKRII